MITLLLDYFITSVIICIFLFSLLQKSLQRLEKELSASQDAVEQGRDKTAVAEALLAKTKVDLIDTAKERDNQMTALATLLSQGD